MQLQGKRALVTGAAGVIGRAICERLVSEGADVVALDVAKGALADLGDHKQIIAATVDLADVEALAKTAEAIGPVDILVNNAGILSNNKLATVTLHDWQHLHRINLDAALVLMQAAIPGMVEKGWGRLISMSSYAAKCGGLTAGTAYTSSKAALIGLTFSVAREYASCGITANAIAPAYVMSPMVFEQLSEEQIQRSLAAIPVGRFCTPEEVAHAVAFLASPLSGFITGEVLDMNGGLQFD